MILEKGQENEDHQNYDIKKRQDNEDHQSYDNEKEGMKMRTIQTMILKKKAKGIKAMMIEMCT